LIINQVLGKVPTISIDKTDGCQMYLSADSLAVEIISSKSSEMNVLIPNGSGDYVSFVIHFCLLLIKLIIFLYIFFRLNNQFQNNLRLQLVENH